MKMFSVAVALIALSITSSGCLLETTLDAKGGGAMTVSYKIKKKAKLGQEKKKFRSKYVKVTSAKIIDGDRLAQFKLEFPDVTKLSTAGFFKNVTVTRSKGSQKGTEVLAAKIVNEKPFKVPEKTAKEIGKEIKFVVTFPGEIVETNAKTTDGKTATWVYGLSQYTEMPEILLTATYKKPAAKGGKKGSSKKGSSKESPPKPK